MLSVLHQPAGKCVMEKWRVKYYRSCKNCLNPLFRFCFFILILFTILPRTVPGPTSGSLPLSSYSIPLSHNSLPIPYACTSPRFFFSLVHLTLPYLTFLLSSLFYYLSRSFYFALSLYFSLSFF